MGRRSALGSSHHLLCYSYYGGFLGRPMDRGHFPISKPGKFRALALVHRQGRGRPLPRGSFRLFHSPFSSSSCRHCFHRPCRCCCSPHCSCFSSVHHVQICGRVQSLWSFTAFFRRFLGCGGAFFSCGLGQSQGSRGLRSRGGRLCPWLVRISLGRSSCPRCIRRLHCSRLPRAHPLLAPARGKACTVSVVQGGGEPGLPRGQPEPCQQKVHPAGAFCASNTSRVPTPLRFAKAARVPITFQTSAEGANQLPTLKRKAQLFLD